MRVLVQRSGKSSVKVDGKTVGEINQGLVLLVAFTEGDSLEIIRTMAKKIVQLRIFPDENDIMNKSILDFGGSILSVSQFTLYGDTSKGNRPSYIKAMKGENAINLYESFNNELKKYVNVATGIFGADMNVFIENIGPTTILMER